MTRCGARTTILTPVRYGRAGQAIAPATGCQPTKSKVHLPLFGEAEYFQISREKAWLGAVEVPVFCTHVSSTASLKV
jgi:hypothetical protein